MIASGRDGPTRSLIEQGARSYVDALNAMAEFRRLIVASSKTILKRRLEDACHALRIPKVKPVFYDWFYPDGLDDSSWDGTEAGAGAYFKIGPLKFVPRGSFSCGLWWSTKEGERVCEAVASIHVPSKRRRLKLWNEFERVVPGQTRCEDGGEPYYSKPILDELGNFEHALDDVVTEWIDIWRKVGGLNVLCAESEEDSE